MPELLRWLEEKPDEAHEYINLTLASLQAEDEAREFKRQEQRRDDEFPKS
ncbi:MAG TPA: hypothetical protein VE775_02235 [Pyrinomonadaceae bacterium]|nr:hypothetical protein [Pyrinomonadaceae bacterium]